MPIHSRFSPCSGFEEKLDSQKGVFKVVDQLRERLSMNAAALQIPVGLEHAHRGVVDLLDMKQIVFEGEFGEDLVESAVPEGSLKLAQEKRQELIEHVANVDDELMEKWLEEKPISGDDLRAAIRRTTVANKFIPVLMGAAFKVF